jgi:hypothetical protein
VNFRRACRVKDPTQDTWFATTLDGRGSGRVLTVLPTLLSSVTVTLTGLVVTGGGILSVNPLTLDHTVVSGNVPGDCACE